MHEQLPPQILTKEQVKLEEDRLLEEAYAEWLVEHPSTELERVDITERHSEIEKLERMVADFELQFSLEELHSITELTAKEAPNHPLREPARITLFEIASILKVLKDETTISADAYNELNAKYKRLSRAVGIINGDNGDKVDHNK